MEDISDMRKKDISMRGKNMISGEKNEKDDLVFAIAFFLQPLQHLNLTRKKEIRDDIGFTLILDLL